MDTMQIITHGEAPYATKVLDDIDEYLEAPQSNQHIRDVGSDGDELQHVGGDGAHGM